jgi:hypothetical protein
LREENDLLAREFTTFKTSQADTYSNGSPCKTGAAGFSEERMSWFKSKRYPSGILQPHGLQNNGLHDGVNALKQTVSRKPKNPLRSFNRSIIALR